MSDVKVKTGQGKVLQPIVVEELTTSADIPKGQVLVVQLKPDGTEKGNGFLIGEPTYNKIFAKNNNFKLKKKSEHD